ncbi:MAG: M14 family zinc carboxypeptidase [Pseudobdellovibrionaceae bacterium]
MKKNIKTHFITLILLFATSANAQFQNIAKDCLGDLKKFPGVFDDKLLAQACEKAKVDAACVSSEGRPIYHYDRTSSSPGAKKILVFSLIHGDETPAGAVGRYWMERLEGLDPRNSWRVIPILNPDGVKYKTRTNANKIDINRNFPTKDWTAAAIDNWKKTTKSNPRRFPGAEAASEPETKCALHHLEDFQPDFVVSVHTPLKVLDFDGPKVSPPPKFDYLPWKSLGSYPGSLGRYMWMERKTPVLTLELKENLPPNFSPFEKLQDIIGTLVKLETANHNQRPASSTKVNFLPVALEH